MLMNKLKNNVLVYTTPFQPAKSDTADPVALVWMQSDQNPTSKCYSLPEYVCDVLMMSFFINKISQCASMTGKCLLLFSVGKRSL